MKEEKIIKGEKINVKPFCIGLIIFGLLFAIIVIASECSSGFYYESSKDANYFWFSIVPYFGSMTFLPFLVLSLIIYFWMSKIEINVTNKRVYGIAAFGKRVDLPLDVISSVGTFVMKGIDVATSSGHIKFYLMKNNIELHKKISELLNKRQDNKETTSSVSTSDADELKKYKQLLDDGAISQEEYDKKKKQLLKL